MATPQPPQPPQQRHTQQKLRPDGRSYHGQDGTTPSSTLRPLSCELSCLHRADGSSLWKSGSTHVLASVYGPMAPRLPSHEHDTCRVSVVIKSGRAASSNSSSSSSSIGLLIEREWEQVLASVLTACIDTNAFARTVVQIVLQIIQEDGSVLAAALHAAVAALMDAGVAMTHLPVATTFLVVQPPPPLLVVEDEQQQEQSTTTTTTTTTEPPLIVLDPTSHEESDPQSSVLVIVTDNDAPDRMLATHCMPASAVSSSSDNNNNSRGVVLTLPLIVACAQAAAKATPAVATFWRLAMEQRVTRESQTLWSS